MIVSMSLGSRVDFRVCRRGRRDAPSPKKKLDRGGLLFTEVLLKRSTSAPPHPSCKGPGSTLPTGGQLSIHRLAATSAPLRCVLLL